MYFFLLNSEYPAYIDALLLRILFTKWSVLTGIDWSRTGERKHLQIFEVFFYLGVLFQKNTIKLLLLRSYSVDPDKQKYTLCFISVCDVWKSDILDLLMIKIQSQSCFLLVVCSISLRSEFMRCETIAPATNKHLFLDANGRLF